MFYKVKNIIDKKTLKSNGPKIEPYGTPFFISDQLLTILFSLIRCFRSDK